MVCNRSSDERVHDKEGREVELRERRTEKSSNEGVHARTKEVSSSRWGDGMAAVVEDWMRL